MNFSFGVQKVSFLSLLFFFLENISLSPTFAYSMTESQIQWTHEVSIGVGVELKWDSEDPDFLTMEMSAPTTGYVGIGFSPSGGMQGSDIAIGWVNEEGIPEIRDLHATGKSMPTEDLQQDYELIAGKQDGFRTTIRFRRRWETCDVNDMTIGNDTMRLIWAWQHDDPETFPAFSFVWHGPKNRGVRSVFMRSPAMPTQFPDYNGYHHQDVKKWDLLMDRVHIDGKKDTVYICKIVKFPHVSQKHHMIGFRPVIAAGNKANVHHISVYHCNVPRGTNKTKNFAAHVGGLTGECYAPNMPPEWSKHCYTFLFSWAIGSEGEMLPEHVGSPLGESSGQTTFFKLEVHYDNPEKRTFSDSSGIRIFYTNKTRQFDSSVLLLGHRVSPFHTIPPHQRNFKSFSFCSGQCTQKGIPENGLRVVSVMLHAHLSGRKIILRHIREGKELPPIAKDSHYDFNYQQFRILRKEVVILPGDELAVECEYDTSNREKFIFGGVSTSQEMCQAILFYYPRSTLTDCRTQPELGSYFDAMGIKSAHGDLLKQFSLPYDPQNNMENGTRLPTEDAFILEGYHLAEVDNPFDLIRISKPSNLQNKSVGDEMRIKSQRQNNFGKHVENAWKNGKHYMYCGGMGQKTIQIESHILEYPKFEKFKELKATSCRYNDARTRNNGVTTNVSLSSLLLLIVVVSVSLVRFVEIILAQKLELN